MDKKETARWFVGSYRHAQPLPRRNLYEAIRLYCNATQAIMADMFGISVQAWRYRERVKRMYHMAEILALYEVSDMKPEQFIQLLKDCA